MFQLKKKLGLLRSIAIYYWKPFNERRLMRFYRQFVKPGALCFDLGAHLGNRTNAWLKLGAKVVAVEPQPHCMDYMQKRFGNNPNLILEQIAIGEKAGELPMHISHFNPTVSTLADANWRKIIDEDTPYKVTWEETITVKMLTLDQLITKHGLPAFCKIDVENYEVEVLQGLSQPLPALSLEYYPATMERAIACLELLEALGPYEYNWSYGESQKLNAPQWITTQEMKNILTSIKRGDTYGDFYARLKLQLKNN